LKGNENLRSQIRAGQRQNPEKEHVPPPVRWGEVFGDDVVAAAMIDRLVHHAEVISLKGDSYRLRNRDLGRVPAAKTDT
jgi:IstB-like ATP binding protein